MRRFLPIAALLAVLLLYGLTVATGSGSRNSLLFFNKRVIKAILVFVR